MVTRKKPLKPLVTAAVITPSVFTAKHHLPQVVPLGAQSVVCFWLRAVISMWHVNVLAVFHSHDDVHNDVSRR